MPENKHTPGPWEMRERETTFRIGDMYAADGFTSCVDGFDVWADERPIVGPHGIPALETDEANARLIAAAPDLLAALKVALPRLQDNARFLRDIQAHAGKVVDAFDAVKAVEMAIARAEGQS